MAFIREYQMASYAGDPFSLRMPKRLRRMLKPPKALRGAFGALGGVLGAAVPLLAGPAAGVLGGAFGGKLTRFLKGSSRGSRIVKALVSRGAPLEQSLGFARSYGLLPAAVEEELGFSPEEYTPADEGDLMFTRSGSPLYMMGDPGIFSRGPKRKRAAAGPKTKAAAKRDARGGKKRKGTSARGGLPPDTPAAGKIFDALTGLGGKGGEFLAGLGLGKGGKGLLGGKRRGMNPTNVKALRHSLRRLEGFERVVKRMEKHYPRLRAATRSGHRSTGHRAGCRCVACRRAA